MKITREGIKSMCIVPRPGDQPSALCIFEYVYFARPDSIMEGTGYSDALLLSSGWCSECLLHYIGLFRLIDVSHLQSVISPFSTVHTLTFYLLTSCVLSGCG